MQKSWQLLSSVPKSLSEQKIRQILSPNDQVAHPIEVNGLFSQVECDQIIAMSNFVQGASDTGTIASDTDEVVVRKMRESQVNWLFPDKKSEWVYQRLDKLISIVNERYKYDLLGFFEGVQIAEYGEGGYYGWHIDIGAGNQSIRKLSISIQLSDENSYEGGDLEFMQFKRHGSRGKGDAIVFPSFLVHQVTPVTRGTRYSMVFWISGKPFS